MKIHFYKNMMKRAIIAGLFGILLILLGSSVVLAQNNNVSGIVTDAQTGEPIPSVNILVVGTSMGTTTDANGHYSLEVPSLQDTLRFSFIGYQTQTIPINGRIEIDVSLQPQAVGLQQLVVVGFGTQEKRTTTTAVATISSSDIETAPVSQTLQSLQGKLSGVRIRQTSGRPGGGIRIRIRGAASISTNSAPLYVVDGIPISGGIDFLSSNMIESISVLKGAAAAALYGSRASNGVVLVQTKTAEGNEMTANFSSYVGVQRVPTARNIDLMEAEEFARYLKYVAKVNGRPVPSKIQNPDQYQGKGTNWQRVVERTAIMQSYNLNIGTGGENYSTSIMAGYLNQPGVLVGSSYKRYSLRINTNFKPTDKLQIGLNIAPVYEYNTTVIESARTSVLGLSRIITPLVGPYNPDGSLRIAIDDSISFAEPNPLLLAKQRVNNDKNLHLLASGSVSYELFNGFSIKTVGSVEMNRHRLFRFSPTSDGTFYNLPPNIPNSFIDYSRLYNWRSATSLNYATDIDKHSIDLLGVFVAQKYRVKGNGIDATQYPVSNEIKTINVAGKLSASTFYGAWTLLSYVGRLNYSYADKYLLQLSLRRDGSSRFGPKNRWGLFPAVSAGWIISSEDFWNVEPVSFLKIRASYGVTGNFEIGNYTYLQNIGTGFYTFGKGLEQTRYVANIADLGLGWEKTKSYDIGVDVSLFNNRLSLTYDYYHRKTTDLLYSVAVPNASGFSSLQTNIGSIKFWGHELSIGGQIIRSSDWSWNTNFNITFSNNEVLALGTANQVLYAGGGGLLQGTNITKVGKPIGMLYGMVYAGLYNNKAELQKYATFDKSVVGTVRYKDTNGDGVLSGADAAIIGNPRPDFYFGLNSNISYKNFNLSFVIAGSYGGQVMALYQQSLVNLDGVFNVLESVKYQWRGQDNPQKAYWPGSKAGTTNLIRDYPNSTMIFDTSHINIENITLGYTLQMNSNPVNKLRLYLTMQNVLFFSHLRTQNSGVSSQTADTALGVTRYAYPVPRTISFGINISL